MVPGHHCEYPYDSSGIGKFSVTEEIARLAKSRAPIIRDEKIISQIAVDDGFISVARR